MAIDIKIDGGSLTELMQKGVQDPSVLAPLKKQDQFAVTFADPINKQEENGEFNNLLFKSVIHELTTTSKQVDRLAFEVDPNLNTYTHVYVPKHHLIPDGIIKKIILQDDLVASIVRARETHISSFGRPRFDIFSTGFVIEPHAGVLDKLSDEKKKEFAAKIRKAVKLISTCGSEEGVAEKDKMSFSQYLMMSARNAVGLGRIATEIIRDRAGNFHSFRPVDAGTIYHAAKQKAAEDKIREEAARELANLKKTKIEPTKLANGDYAWIQVIEGMPKQAFTDKELYVCNFYPVVDVETLGYPVTPIDTMFHAIATHINITVHNRMYFQTGRASRGMLIFKGEDINPLALERIKQQFNASINGVGNSWRMPVLSCPIDGDIIYENIDTSASRDAEFVYLLDQNARVIISAFQMSPDELAGWNYLSKGTNSQALSEGNQEFRIESGRDQGIRPLLNKFEDFINSHLFPLIDSELSEYCRVRLVGLDVDTPEKQAIRLIQDQPIHGTYDWILEKVEKKIIGKAMGGDYPLNPQYQNVLNMFFTVGQQKAFFMGDEAARNDETLAFIPNQWWFNWQQLLMQKKQMEQQAQMAQQQAMAMQAQGGQPMDPGQGVTADGQDPGQVEENNSMGQAPNANQASETQPSEAPGMPTGEDLTRSIDQAMYVLTKSENMPGSKRKLLAQQKALIEKFKKELEVEEKALLEEIDKIID